MAGLDNSLLASPRLLVTLVVQCGSRLAPRPGELASSTFAQLLPTARQASAEAAGSRLGRQLAEAADALEAALRAEAAEPAVHLARVKELGTQLARLMHQYWEQPAQVQAAHVEQGWAAAARACAYMRCGNLLADRGAAAGESGSKLRCRCGGVQCGVGGRSCFWAGRLLACTSGWTFCCIFMQRKLTHPTEPQLGLATLHCCSACRAVNYCSRECATMDWKTGGHKLVCKALAAARQG